MSCSLTLPSYTITLKGDGGGDDGFDGTAGPSTPILSGTNVQTTAIKNLFFRNAAVFSSGAAISITGTSSPTIDQAVFTGNVANNNGGAVSISQAGGSPNSPVIITDSTFGGASPNFASSGGALHIINVTGLFLSGNAFIGNTATTEGGGLLIEIAASPNPLVTQIGNLFSGNRVTEAQNVFGGGGEAFISLGGDGADITSRNDRLLNNSASAGNGGGLFVDLSNSSFRGENLVVAGNFADAGGGGIRFISGGPVDLYDSTVAGNAVGASGVGPAVAGSGGALSLINSIVYGNGASPALEISSFSVTGSFSDACQPDQLGNPVPIAGGGNICVDPLLVNPSPGVGDVHETAASPTIDRGSNALVPPSLSTDYEGDARISDGDNDANAVVDMGADERPFSPTAVSVSLFTARGSRGGVRLRWRTGTEAELLGFNLYRQWKSKLVKLNRALIPSVFGGTPSGHAYSWLDSRAPKTRGLLRYRLQAVNLDGTRSRVGSVAVAH